MKRRRYKLDYYYLSSADMGELIPIGMWEVLPGDTFVGQSSVLVRLLQTVFPVSHPTRVRVHSWFVPWRLVWAGWEQFVTSQGTSLPTVTSTSTNGDLLDYFGLGRVAGVQVNALPVRAYNKVWNEYYRDQDLQTARGEDDLTIARVCWGKDRYTAARPWPQKGTAVRIPLGATAPVKGIGIETSVANYTNKVVRETGSSGDVTYANAVPAYDASGNRLWVRKSSSGTPHDLQILADLSAAEGALVDDVRRAFAIQRFQQARARWGSRYAEYLQYLGVTPSDRSLGRPEYIGGGAAMVSWSEVLQTTTPSSDTLKNALGRMGGHGIAVVRSRRYRKFFEEHGVLLTLLSVVPRGVYAQGCPRIFLKNSWEHFYVPELYNIGQERISVREIYFGSADTVFGYGPRYQDYTSSQNIVTGEMRVGRPLDAFHMARSFSSEPVLNSSFVSCDPAKRIFAVTSTDTVWIAASHTVKAHRMVRIAHEGAAI